MLKKFITVITAFMMAAATYAGVGTVSMDVLKIPVGVKAQGMGGAYIALSDDLEALDINPAGLAFIERSEALFIHDLYLQDVFYDSVYFGAGLGDAGSLGFSVKYLSAGKLTSTLETPLGTYGGTGEEVSGYNFLASCGFATGLDKLSYNDFSKNVKLGADLKVTGEGLGKDYSNIGISLDLGTILTIVMEDADVIADRGQFSWNKAGLGLVFKNLGTSFSGSITPIDIAFGGYLQCINAGARNNRIRFSLDTDYDIGTGINLKGGAEYRQFVEGFVFALRAGGGFNPEERSGGSLSFGGDIGIKTMENQYLLEYVFMPFGELGTNQKIGLYIKF